MRRRGTSTASSWRARIALALLAGSCSACLFAYRLSLPSIHDRADGCRLGTPPPPPLAYELWFAAVLVGFGNTVLLGTLCANAFVISRRRGLWWLAATLASIGLVLTIFHIFPYLGCDA